MPPKKKGKGGKGTGGIIDGTSISEMSREQLEPFVLRIENELERERAERNFFQLESDKIRTFWEIAKEQIEEYKAEIRNKETELEEAEERHHQDIKLYHQKVKHLMYEENSELAESQVGNMIALKEMETDYKKQETELLRDKRDLRNQIRELQEIHLDQLRTVYSENAKKNKKIRDECEKKCRLLEAKYQTELHKQQDKLDLKNDIDISKIEELKDTHIQTLIRNHEEAFQNLTKFYNKITEDNLNAISELKDELRKTKLSKEDLENEMKIVKRQNQKLTMPLKIAQQRIVHLNHKISTHERSERLHKITNKQANKEKISRNNLKYAHDALLLAYDVMQNENNYLQKSTIENIVDLQQRINLRNLISEQRISELNDLIGTKEEQIKKLTAIVEDKKPVMLTDADMKKILEEKDQQISKINKELHAVMKSHNDLVRMYKSKPHIRKISQSADEKSSKT